MLTKTSIGYTCKDLNERSVTYCKTTTITLVLHYLAPMIVYVAIGGIARNGISYDKKRIMNFRLSNCQESFLQQRSRHVLKTKTKPNIN